MSAALSLGKVSDISTSDERQTLRRLRMLMQATAIVGGPLFLVGVLLHPARDGAGIAAVGDIYALTHDLLAVALLLQVLSLVSLYALAARKFGPSGVLVFAFAVVGTVLYFGFILLDGNVNLLLARHTPELVHRLDQVTTFADLQIGFLLVAFPALIVFLLSYVMLGRLLSRHGFAGPGWLLAIGAVVYVVGGLMIFVLGPTSPAVETLEVTGAAPYAIGYAWLGWRWGQARPNPSATEASAIVPADIV